jgi:ABC-type sugar transport system ATPase subunit
MAFLEVDRIKKDYAGTQALKGVSFTADEGQVVAICGENGAGKTTLMKVLAGVVQPNGGTVSMNGRQISIPNPHAAFDYGIRTVYQELSLVPFLSVTENILMGDLPHKLFKWSVDWKRAHTRAAEIFEGLGFPPIDVRKKTSTYSVAYRQMIEIAKAVVDNPKVLILDEPSAVLSQKELHYLFDLIARLRGAGTTILYISHRLEEVFEIADKILVLKDGESMGTVIPSEIEPSDLIKMMVGRPLHDIYPVRNSRLGKTILRVEGLSRENAFRNVSFSIRAGEIVGLFGLVGSGRTEVMRCLFGADRPSAGTITLDGGPFAPRDPGEAVRAGIGMVTEERKKDGLSLPSSIQDNAGLATMNQVSRSGVLSRSRQKRAVTGKVDELSIRPRDIRVPVKYLSGGNQQKVVLAKWLLLEKLKLLILDEPTRGVDVKTKVEIYHLIHNLSVQDVAIIMVSSELPEIIGMCDRTLVMREGVLEKEFNRSESTEETLLICAAGVAGNGN